ncbi:MAG TPA: rRNA maturation RNase YbeY [Candidatus Paceibacterota bacterium]
MAKHIPFVTIGRLLLPHPYTLSVVLAGDTRARRLNIIYRKKKYAPNVLAFPLTLTEGEIILNVPKAKREAHSFGTTAKNHMAHLYVHAILHLLGMRHGTPMEKKEHAILKKLDFL